eukprot:gene32250-39823_t
MAASGALCRRSSHWSKSAQLRMVSYTTVRCWASSATVLAEWSANKSPLWPGMATADFTRARIGAKDDYNVLRLSGSYSRSLPRDWQVRAVVNGQYTPDALIPGEQFGAGGASSVRGFSEREISNDKGVSGNLELYTPNLCKSERWQCRALAFYDTAHVSRNHALAGELASTTIGSTGLGLRVLMATYLNLQLDYGHVVQAGATGRGSANRLHRKLLAATVAACFGAAAHANPTAPQVVAGQAQFSQQGNVFSITNAPNTIINWQSFSINAGEITRFIQQGGDSKVLNRIVGQDPSKILGSLQSNGKVYLINPNGVLFGKDARVDVNGLVASSLAISNNDFLAGKNHFSGEGAGKVVNQGSIATPGGGQVYLIGSSVENSGVITSPQGEVILAAGKSVQLVDSANPDVHVVLSAPADQALNLGQVLAAGGKVGIYGALVNQRGRINADSAAVGANGKIVLKASAANGTTLLEAGSHTSAVNSAGKGEQFIRERLFRPFDTTKAAGMGIGV